MKPNDQKSFKRRDIFPVTP
jgi:hypothetical protein